VPLAVERNQLDHEAATRTMCNLAHLVTMAIQLVRV
jgi:hypothetical protein